MVQVFKLRVQLGLKYISKMSEIRTPEQSKLHGAGEKNLLQTRKSNKNDGINIENR